MTVPTHRIKNDTNLYYILLMVSSVLTALYADETFKMLIGDHIGKIGTAITIIGIGVRWLKPRGETKSNLDILDDDENEYVYADESIQMIIIIFIAVAMGYDYDYVPKEVAENKYCTCHELNMKKLTNNLYQQCIEKDCK